MSDSSKPVGSISWTDLTVPDAEKVREFYEEVAGWSSEPVDMGGYRDYCMKTAGNGETVAGICHTRGMNADLPPQWLIYITVADLSQSIEKCLVMGGEVLHRRDDAGFAVIKDPAGAVAALYQQPGES